MLHSVDMTACLLFILCDLTSLDDWWWWLHHQYCGIIKHASHGYDITQCGMSTHSTSVFEQILACELIHSTHMSTLVTICGILFIFLAVAEEKSLPWCMTVWNSGLLKLMPQYLWTLLNFCISLAEQPGRLDRCAVYEYPIHVSISGKMLMVLPVQ